MCWPLRALFFSSTLNGRLVQIKFNSITALLMFCNANWASSGISSFFLTYSIDVFLRSSTAAINSLSSEDGISSGAFVTVPTMKGWVFFMSERLQRPRPCTMTVRLLPAPGISNTRIILAYTPISYKSFRDGFSWSESF